MVLGAHTRYATRFALFRVQIFRGSPLDHENHENITPRKIPAIRYIPCTQEPIAPPTYNVPLMRKGWLQHFLNSIMTLSREGMAVVGAVLPFERNMKFLSRMAR